MRGTITSVVTRDSVAALTFDDGPHPEYTPLLLDILERYGARATFFMVGEAAQRHPELVQQVAQAGHAVGNHSWDHPFFPSLPSEERQKQIRACEQALAPYGRRLFRPPYGAENSWLTPRCHARLHYQVVAWNLDAEDWLERDPAWMAEVLARGIQPGSIVLLHDAICGREQPVPQYNREPMIAALNLFLEGLGGRFQLCHDPGVAPPRAPAILQLGNPNQGGSNESFRLTK